MISTYFSQIKYSLIVMKEHVVSPSGHIILNFTYTEALIRWLRLLEAAVCASEMTLFDRLRASLREPKCHYLFGTATSCSCEQCP